ncbi:MAG TPA: amidohydrolase [Nitrosomonas sp.]|nr:amidohydrolase [Nitrosomonas sp.]
MDFDPEGKRLPIKIDTATNAEYCPQPLTATEQAANHYAHQVVDQAAKATRKSRRAFLKTLAGSAATLLAFNQVFARSGQTGGYFSVAQEAAYDPSVAHNSIGGDEFIFDIQNHCVDPSGKWAQGKSGQRWITVLNQVFGQRRKCAADQFDCYSAEQMIKEVFLDSDTDVCVVSALWGGRDSNPTPIDYAAQARQLAATSGANHRILIQGGVMPNEPGGLEFMETQAKDYGVAAWKIYPQWGPSGSGYFMDDPEYGIPMIEKARDLDVKIICAHRGLPLGGMAYQYSHPADIARAAQLYPDVTFICYHSGFEAGVDEGPYSPDTAQGVDRLIKAHQENGFRPDKGNLYAELGSVWRYFMSKPDQAAHLLGKLIKYFGAERICWGTDALWYGSPQDQIQSFRSFQISEMFQEQYGYPAITARMRQQIFGHNAAKVYGLDIPEMQKTLRSDNISKLKTVYSEAINPSFETFGPKTRREFLSIVSAHHGRPG